jgi:phospholipase C
MLAILTLLFNCKSLHADLALMQSQIKHVVIVVMENRSFDNVIAWLYDENTQPAHFITLEDNPRFLGLYQANLSPYTNNLVNSKGEIVFSCAPIKGIPSVTTTPFLNSPKFDPNEVFANVTDQIFGSGTEPTMLGFLQDYASIWDEDDWINQKSDICAVMETYTDKELPIIYGLGRHYAVSDKWFSSVPTQTNPNRAFIFCGTSEGVVDNGFLGKNLFHSDTVWNRLSEESPDTSWAIFWQCDMLPIIYPGPMSGTNTFANLKKIPNLQDHFQTLDYFHQLARLGQLPDVTFIEPQWTTSINVSPKEKEVLEYIYNQDFIIGLQGNDLHPPGDIRTGENFLSNIYTSLIANKEAWGQTLLIITFDEHGGLFDHVVPPAATPPDNNSQNGFSFDRYGVRVPILFISPLIEKGTVIRSNDPNVPFDHTSLIATILKWKNVDKSKWNLGNRVAVAPTFEDVITLTLAQAREDSILAEISNSKHDVVQIGDQICLRNKDGNYLTSPKFHALHLATVDSAENKTCFNFVSGAGILTHGSFVYVKSLDSQLENSCFLETQLKNFDCVYAKESHQPGQWWTIKSLDSPIVGAEICYGDRVYIENHIYLDLLQLVPGRLSEVVGTFGKHACSKPITGEGCDDEYWIIERP